MRKIVFGCLGAAAVAFALQLTVADVQAGFFNRCDPCVPVEWGPCDAVLSDPCAPIGCFDGCGFNGCFDGCLPNGRNGNGGGGFFLRGHMEAGFFANGHGNRSTYGVANTFAGARGADPWSGNSNLLQNNRLTGGQMNQVYLSMGRAVDGRRGLDIGGTIDFAWGSDVYQVQSRGLEFDTGRMGWSSADEWQGSGRWGSGDYFSAFPQAFVEVAFDRWNVKAGKFYLPFGSTSFKSTDNFFYSWSPTKMIAPTTGGGVLTTYRVNNRLSVIGGWTNGLDQFGETSNDNAFIGGFNFSPTSRFNIRYTLATGRNTYEPHMWVAGDDRLQYFVNSLVVTTRLSHRLTLTSDWTYNQTRARFAGEYVEGIYAYGFNNELVFQANNRWAFGTRFGMLRPDWTDRKTEWYTVSLGANWTPNQWLTVKPEVRYDWTTRGDSADRVWFNDTRNTYQVSGGVSAVVKF